VTESLIVIASSFASLFFVDPFFKGGLTKFAGAKAITLIFGYGALGAHLLGRAIVAPERFRLAAYEVLRAWWPALVLAGFVLSGSLYARLAEDIQETFLGLGLGLLFLPGFALAVRCADKPMALLRWLVVVYAATAVSMIVLLLLDDHIFHEAIFVTVPAGAYFLLHRQLTWWRALLGLALIGACLYSFKNTTFLIVLLTLGGCIAIAIGRALRRSDPIARVIGMLVLVPLLLAVVGGLGWAWWDNREVLPSGNVPYRTYMYEIAWGKFLASPLWGTAFTDASIVYFTLFQVDLPTQYLPTHSDILDLLAHGGAIAFLLWLVLFLRALSIAWATAAVLIRRDEGVDLRPWQWLGVLSLIQGGAFITYAINPILISPVHAFFVWGSLGVMWALHRELTAQPLPVRMTRAQYLKQMVLR
jgi:hypothetical protein